jgi:ABC-type proline/glycine betaine transport system substrate-binding protein
MENIILDNKNQKLAQKINQALKNNPKLVSKYQQAKDFVAENEASLKLWLNKKL